MDLAALEAAVTDETACVLVQSPNFFGTIEDVAAIAEIAHKKGALLIVVDCGGGVAGDCEAAGGGGYCFDGGAVVWRGGGLWRAVLRRDCVRRRSFCGRCRDGLWARRRIRTASADLC